MLKNANLKKNMRYFIRVLPLAGIIVSAFLPLSPIGRQLLVLVLLVWLQIYFLLDVFLFGK